MIPHGSTSVQMKKKRQDKEEDDAKILRLDNLVKMNGFQKDWKRISTIHILGWDYQLYAIEFEYHAFVLYTYIYISHVSMPTGKPCFGNTIGLVGHQLWPNTPHSKCGFTPKFANPKRPTTRHTCMALVHGLLHYCKPLTTKGKVNRGMRRHGLLLRILQGSDDADDRKWKPFFNLKTNRQVSGLRRGQRNTKRRNNANHVHMLTTWGFLRFQGAKPPHFWSTLPHGWISLSLVHSLFPSIHCMFESMFGENQRLVTDEPVEFEKQ